MKTLAPHIQTLANLYPRAVVGDLGPDGPYKEVNAWIEAPFQPAIHANDAAVALHTFMVRTHGLQTRLYRPTRQERRTRNERPTMHIGKVRNRLTMTTPAFGVPGHITPTGTFQGWKLQIQAAPSRDKAWIGFPAPHDYEDVRWLESLHILEVTHSDYRNHEAALYSINTAAPYPEQLIASHDAAKDDDLVTIQNALGDYREQRQVDSLNRFGEVLGLTQSHLDYIDRVAPTASPRATQHCHYLTGVALQHFGLKK